MTVVNWNCWIGDESGGSQVALTGIWQPKPRPWPQPVQIGSDHLYLDGTLEVQRFAYRRTIRFNMPRATRAQKEAIEALYYRWDDPEDGGQQKKVQCNNGGTSDGGKTFLCAWAKEPSFQPVDDRLPERWEVVTDFLIESEVG